MKATLIWNYRGPGKKVGILRYANGITLRAWRIAAHIWFPRKGLD